MINNNNRGFSFSNLNIGLKFVLATGIGLILMLSVNMLITINMQRSALNDLLQASVEIVEKMTERQVAASHESLNLKATRLARMLAEISPEAIAEFELSSLLNYLNVASEDPDISYVAIENVDGNIMVSSGDKETVKDNKIIIHPIVSEGIQLGKILVGYNDNRVAGIITDTRKESESSLGAMSDVRDATVDAATIKMVMMLLVISLFGCTVVYLIARSLMQPLNNVADVMNDISEGEGDLTHRLQSRGTDEVARVANSFNKFSDKIHSLVIKIKHASETINYGSREISDSNISLSQRTEEQSAMLEEMGSNIAEMNTSVQQSADSAMKANAMGSDAKGHAENGGKIVKDAILAMEEIDKSSMEIASIISVIDEIAFQTNLLSLNASVEAARAGEQGRGFAVVAAEVKGLAERSAEAAREVKALINSSAEKVKSGTKLVYDSGNILESIIDSVNRVTDTISDISLTSQEQANGINELNTAMQQIEKMTQENATVVEETAASSEHMNQQAQTLNGLVSQFKIDEDQEQLNSFRSQDINAEDAEVERTSDDTNRIVPIPLFQN